MKKKKYKCDICQDTGKWSNPFDQEFKCDCQIKKRKRADYRGFVQHVWEWNADGLPFGLSDLRTLSKKYNCPIPKEYR